MFVSILELLVEGVLQGEHQIHLSTIFIPVSLDQSRSPSTL